MPSCRILLVQQGGSGGIGRADDLLAEALGQLSPHLSLEVRTVRRAASGTGRGTQSPVSFTARTLVAYHRFRPHVVVFDHVNLAPIRFGMLGDARFVTVVHGWDVWFPLAAARRRALSAMDAVWSVSQFTTSRMRMQGIDTTAHLLPWGLTDRQRRLLSEGATPRSRPNDLRLLSVARLDPAERHKGIDHVIQALPAIARELPAIKYTIVGYGADRERLEVLANARGVGHLVEFMGHVSESDLYVSYGNSDVFVLPSDQEGFGLVFLEAMAAGRPIVAARAGGVPEVVLEGETGLLVEYGDVDEIAYAVIRLGADPDLRIALGRAGQRRVEERFTMRCLAERVAGLLDALAPSAAA
jgi:glycosyltransferase involved in cell wall biosynthesis